MPATRLSADTLFRATDPVGLTDLNQAELLGQDRVLQAIQLALGVDQPGFNLFVMSQPGLPVRGLMQQYLHDHAQHRPTPPDWLYVHNFTDSFLPQAFSVPAGRGSRLAQDLRQLVDELQLAIPAEFESEGYRHQRQAIDDQIKEQQERAFAAVEEAAVQRGLALLRTPTGMGVAPVQEGEVISPQAFEQLPEERQEQLRHSMEEVHHLLQEVVRRGAQWETQRRDQVRALNRQVMGRAIESLIDRLRSGYTDLPEVLQHLDRLEADLLEHPAALMLRTQGESENPVEASLGRLLAERSPLDRYLANLVVDHTVNHGAPVVEEDHPNLANLVGRVEYRPQFGSLITDFSLIRPGALHRANGGYLLLEARRLLGQPYAWDELKRALRTGQIQIRSMADLAGLGGALSLQPQAIPLQVKVILLGDRPTYYLLAQLDPDFAQLFKVMADLEDLLPRTSALEQNLAAQLSTAAAQRGLAPSGPQALARLVEYAARLAGDAHSLTTQLDTLLDLWAEAAHLVPTPPLSAEAVEQAIEQRRQRANRLQNQLQSQVSRGIQRLETRGSQVGQVNGLSVFELAGVPFGHPARITATVRLGTGELIDIEREVALGGPLHSKGVLILASFLGQRYARLMPLSLRASLVFEQSYGLIDGDSASLAELAALLSALAQVPLAQNLALTGSVDQLGRVQAIGGVNDKIEGFFDLCLAGGLTGEQGVIIPAANAQHLMLDRRVVQAVNQGLFAVYTVETVDDCLELLTGLGAGLPDANGLFPPDSFNGKVQHQLGLLAEQARKQHRPPG